MTEHPVHAKTMQGQGLLQPLFEARGRRLIPLFQLAVELLEGLKRLLDARCSRLRHNDCSLLDK